tara:strand:+ start:465 stop:1451 length:987 start_codon:yes stop_codon:yes gene_type:complete
MKNILITGGAGYIGSAVAHLLIDKGYSLTIIDSLITGDKRLVPKKAIFKVVDISDKKKIKKILNKKKFDIVMHFAGLIRVDESVKKPKKYIRNNYEKSKTFIDSCIQFGHKNIIFSSTASIYGDTKNIKVSENSRIKPLNPYAKSKMMIENYLKKKSKQKKLNYIILRYFNVAGAENKLRTGLISKISTHLIKIASEVAIKKRDKLIINGNDYNTFDGTAVRDYIHVSDLANIHLIVSKYLINKKSSDIFNCGYGKGFSVKQIVNQLNLILKKKIKTEIGIKRKSDSKYLVANVNKFKKKFKWKPKFNDIKYIIKSSIKWEKKLKKIN